MLYTIDSDFYSKTDRESLVLNNSKYHYCNDCLGENVRKTRQMIDRISCMSVKLHWKFSLHIVWILLFLIGYFNYLYLIVHIEWCFNSFDISVNTSCLVYNFWSIETKPIVKKNFFIHVLAVFIFFRQLSLCRYVLPDSRNGNSKQHSMLC